MDYYRLLNVTRCVSTLLHASATAVIKCLTCACLDGFCGGGYAACSCRTASAKEIKDAYFRLGWSNRGTRAFIARKPVWC